MRTDVRLASYVENCKKCKELGKAKDPAFKDLRAQLKTEMTKINQMIKKQDKMFLVAVNILLNLAEDVTIERKMKKRKIAKKIIRLLERNNTHLLMITLIFLKKLSIFADNKN